MGMSKDWKQYIRSLRERGWTCEPRGKHFALRHEQRGDMLVIPSTASDHRALKNCMAQVKRCERPLETRYN